MFFSVGDVYVALGVDLANIAGVQPPLGVDRFAGFIGKLVISLHYAGAARKDFPIHRNFYFYIIQRLADSSPFYLRNRAYANYRGSLRQAKSFYNWNSES